MMDYPMPPGLLRSLVLLAEILAAGAATGQDFEATWQQMRGRQPQPATGVALRRKVLPQQVSDRAAVLALGPELFSWPGYLSPGRPLFFSCVVGPRDVA